MIRGQNRYIVLLLLFFAVQSAHAQGHLFSELKVDRSSVYVGQPVRVSVAVFTSTWFTKGVSPGNVKVNGAFTVYFRSVSQSRRINGKTYAGVELIFNVFPYDDEDITFPSLEFIVDTPDEGGYKAVQRKIVTQERNIKVKPIPKGYESEEWLVASGLTVNDNWDGDLRQVKVGDVLVRTISREVSGTVAELVPPIQWDTIQGVSLYPSRSTVNSNKTKTSISASRTDGMQYLFEKEGHIEIPEKVLTWWNPDQNKLYKRTLPAIAIDVLPNPDLGMLESIRDSLAISSELPLETNGKSAWDNLLERFTLKQLILAAIVFLILVWLVYRVFKWVFVSKKLPQLIQTRRQEYLQSEKYYFRQFRAAARKQDARVGLRALYRWIDVIHLKEPSLHYFALTYGNEELLMEVESLFEMAEIEDKEPVKIKLRNWSRAREKYLLQVGNNETRDDISWINPLNK